MKQKVELAGRSMVFNIIFVIMNLGGLTLLTMGSHDSFKDSGSWMSLLGILLMLLSSVAIFIFRGRLMMSSVARILVGGLFIVSGLVKANDPLGFSYKLEEYFEDGALAYRIKELFGAPGFSLEFLIEWALFLSVVICIAEIVLGVLVIIGGKIKTVSYLLLGMMLFFTFLTWHTANCDASNKFWDRDTYAANDPVGIAKVEQAADSDELKVFSQDANEIVVDELKQPQCVDDCGCFGDAMKGSVGRSLTPKESLWKDIVLLYLVIWIFISQWIIKPNTRRANFYFTVLSLLVVVFFSWIFTWYFPILFAAIAILGALWILRAGGVILGNHYGSALVATILTCIFVFFVLRYKPMKDYRPYAVGSNLIEKMNDGVPGVYESYYFVTNKQTGEKSRIEMNKLPADIWTNTKKWAYDFDTTICVVPTKLPSISEQFGPFLNVDEVTEADRSLSFVGDLYKENMVENIRVKNTSADEIYDVPMEEFELVDYPSEYYTILDTVTMLNEELTEIAIRENILEQDQIVILSAKNLTEANWDQIDRIKEIYEGCKKAGIPFLIISNGTAEQLAAFRTKYKFNVPIFMNDETELKAIARSNPSLLVLEKATVVGKYAHRSIPTWEWLKENDLKK